MKQIPKEWLVLIIIVIFIAGISLWERQRPKGTPGVEELGKATARLEKEENSVTVIIEYLPDKSSSQLVFSLTLDTHSVNLDGFDFEKDVALVKDGKSYPAKASGLTGADHHRQGKISFPKIETPFTVRVLNLSGVPVREFSFDKI